MELAEDFSLTLPLIFTVLAVILATLWVKLRSAAEKQPAEESHDRVVKERVAETLEDEQKGEEDQAVVEEEPERTGEDQAPEEKVPKRTEESQAPEENVPKRTEESQAPEEKVPKRTDIETVPVEEVGTAEELTDAKESETDTAECVEERTPSSQSSQEEEEDSKEEDVETENDKVLKISEADDADDEDFSFKYLPGKLRGSDYEKMLTPDELDEEQRVQRKQLGAIFEMMENNQETFGMMSEGDLEEQLKLYNM